MTGKALARGFGIDRAIDVPWTLNRPDVRQLRVEARGSTTRQYGRWFGDISCAQLVAKVER